MPRGGGDCLDQVMLERAPAWFSNSSSRADWNGLDWRADKLATPPKFVDGSPFYRLQMVLARHEVAMPPGTQAAVARNCSAAAAGSYAA